MKPLTRLAFLVAVFTMLAAEPCAAQDDTTVIDEDEAFLSDGPEIEGEGEAEAEPAEPEGEEAAKEGEADAGAGEKWGGKLRDHRHQGFVNVLFGTGWHMVAPYDKDNPDKACGYDADGESEPVCTGRSPFHMDFLAGFGVKDGLEVFAMFKLGLDRPDPRLPERMMMIGAGIKVYSPSDGLFKISFGVAPLFDFSPRRVDKYDFLIHVPIGAHFDFLPWLGAYIQVAPNISMVTEFLLDLTAGIGVQGRFP